MGFEDIPEDREESYPCDCGGEIIKDTLGAWFCTKDCGRMHDTE